MVEEDLKYMLIQISKDAEFIKEKVERIEEFTYHLNKRLISTEKTHSYIKGGFYVFVALFGIFMALSTINS
ncbi:MAG: hypothetical protein Unbinned2990contig1001_42 [Prokaryotic dsDNA virus sp.]|nr:MAG: hypothetical protein Unbinned2990contig1001_42 [Prokaryotic dsDNA virus sp.]